MRFHLLGLAHTRLGAGYAACAFTGKCERLARLLSALGHTALGQPDAAAALTNLQNVTPAS